MNLSKSILTTSEGQITLLVYVINILNLVGAWDWVSNWHSGLLMAIAGGAYKVARGLAKAGVLRAPA